MSHEHCEHPVLHLSLKIAKLAVHTAAVVAMASAACELHQLHKTIAARK